VPLGVVGSLSRDLVDGSPPRPGGGVYYAARALHALGRRAALLTKCADGHREELLSPLTAFGVPVEWRPATETTIFAFSYDGDRRLMAVESVGDPWTPEDVAGALADVRWLHVGALLRSDFPPETLEALARGRNLSLDGQALVRPGRAGPLELDADFDPTILSHVRILKLSEEEAKALLGEVDERTVSELGVPEVVVTLGPRGSIVFADGRAERIAVTPLEDVDPTGAGDSFATGYLAARSAGHAPAGAARKASALVLDLLAP
jgi:sugar/nucleoside kinase (ribokinase family)